MADSACPDCGAVVPATAARCSACGANLQAIVAL
ncbi:MAG: zinc-ribbon domain-containing protein, partial [Gemmatimonadales bacterium]